MSCSQIELEGFYVAHVIVTIRSASAMTVRKSAASDDRPLESGPLRPPPVLARLRGERAFSVILGLVLFFSALAFYWGAVLRFPIEHTKWLDLRPYPDATEYFAQARSMDRSGFPSIQIGEEKLSSRFPPGYPLLMLPWLHCRFSAPVFAPFRTNQTVGLILILATYLFYLALKRPLAAGLAALTLATMPAFVTYSHSSLSDLAGAGISLLAFGLMFRAVQTPAGLHLRRGCRPRPFYPDPPAAYLSRATFDWHGTISRNPIAGTLASPLRPLSRRFRGGRESFFHSELPGVWQPLSDRI